MKKLLTHIPVSLSVLAKKAGVSAGKAFDLLYDLETAHHAARGMLPNASGWCEPSTRYMAIDTAKRTMPDTPKLMRISKRRPATACPIYASASENRPSLASANILSKRSARSKKVSAPPTPSKKGTIATRSKAARKNSTADFSRADCQPDWWPGKTCPDASATGGNTGAAKG